MGFRPSNWESPRREASDDDNDAPGMEDLPYLPVGNDERHNDNDAHGSEGLSHLPVGNDKRH